MRTALRKLWGDYTATPGRFIMMVIAIALCSTAIISMLFTYKVLTREMQRNYLGTNPAAAHILIGNSGETDQSQYALEQLRKNSLITATEIGEKHYFQVEVAPGEFITALIFISDEPRKLQINKAPLDQGNWPAIGEILLERKALGVAKLALGDKIKLQGEKTHALTISGLVHDPALAPANAEHLIYGYMSQATSRALGEPEGNRYLKVTVAPENMNKQAIEKIVATAVKDISRFVKVYEIHIPPPMQHPHQTQMISGLNMLLMFSLLAVLLGALLIATTLWGMLAQQVRQIAIMKTLGASSQQITFLYLVLVSVLGLLALTIGFPFGVMAGQGLVTITADMLNLKIVDNRLPASLWLLNGAFCLGLPALLAYFPIRQSAHKRVRAALDDYGVANSHSPKGVHISLRFLSPLFAMLVRNLVRRPGRLSFTLLLLAIAGATFISSQNLLASWDGLAQAAHKHRQYQIEISFPGTQSIDAIQAVLQKNSGIAHTEFFYRTNTSVARADGLIIKEVYPDGGHGSFTLFSLPAQTKTIDVNIKGGRWLDENIQGEVVINHLAQALFFADKKIGDEIYLHTQDDNKKYRLVGIMDEPLTGASVYTTPTHNTINCLRIQLINSDTNHIEQITTQLKQQFEHAGVPINGITTEIARQQSGNGHLMIMVLILVMIAIAMTIVGLFSLATVMSTNVAERLREFAIMRSLGAKNATIFSLVVNEAFLIALVSFLLSLPFASVFSSLMISRLSAMSLQPLDLAFSKDGLAIWLALVLTGALLASLAPAMHATRSTLREALGFL